MKTLMKEAARHRACDVQYVQYYAVFPDRSWNYYRRATSCERATVDFTFFLFGGGRETVYARHAAVGLAVSIIL